MVKAVTLALLATAATSSAFAVPAPSYYSDLRQFMAVEGDHTTTPRQRRLDARRAASAAMASGDDGTGSERGQGPCLRVGKALASLHRGGDAAVAGPPGNGNRNGPAGAVQGAWAAYLEALDKRPVLTKCVTSGVISCVGDVMAQWLLVAGSGQRLVLDWGRVALYTAIATLYIPVVIHYWFEQMERLSRSRFVTSRAKGNKYANALMVLSMDQTVGAAIVNVGFYTVYTAAVCAVGGRFFPLAGVVAEAQKKVRSEFWGMMLMNWRIWPMANFINFALIPPKLRVLFSNCVAVIWNVFLSTTANK